MGVDMLRASPVTPATPGLNSILLLRTIADHASSTEAAVDLIASTERGCTWLYCVCDMQGHAAVVEAGKYIPSGEPFDPLQYVNSTELKALLPNEEFLSLYSSDDIYDR